MHDPADVLLGFGVGRNAVVAINGTFASVVGGMLFFAATLRIRLAIRCFAKGCLLR